MSKQHLKILATALALSTSALILSSCSTGVAGTYPKKPVSVDTNVSVILPQPEKTPEPTPPNKEDQADQPQPQPPEPEPEEPSKPKTPTELTLPTFKTAVSNTPVKQIDIIDPTTVKSDEVATVTNITPSQNQNKDSKQTSYINPINRQLINYYSFSVAAYNALIKYDFNKNDNDISTEIAKKTNANIKNSAISDVLDNGSVGNLLTFQKDSKASAELAKVLLVGDEASQVSDLDQSKVSKEYSTPTVTTSNETTDSNNVVNTNGVTLTSSSLTLLSDEPQPTNDSITNPNPDNLDSNTNDPQDAPATPQMSTSEKALHGLIGSNNVPGLLSKNGEVVLLAPGSKDKVTAQDVYKTINDNKFSELTQKNYKVVGITLAPTPVTLEHIKTVVTENIDKSVDSNYSFDNRVQGTNFLGALDELGILSGEATKFSANKYEEAAKAGTFFAFATGDGEGYNPFALALYSSDEKYTALKTGSVFVTTNSATATPCGDFSKYYCITAYSELSVNNKDKSQQESTAGSAFATGYVAGAATLVKTAFPFFTPENIQTTLLTTAKDLGETGVDAQYGWGLVQPQDAIQGPKQILNGKFVVDLNNNRDLITASSYAFNNNISGTGDLVIKAYPESPTKIIINGNNTFTGTTYIKDSAIVELNGKIGNTEVTNDAFLYGTGMITGNLKNAGKVASYNINYDTSKLRTLNFNGILFFESKDPSSLVVKGNYEQANTGTLEVLLGAPLIVNGDATLSGNLVVKGISKSLVLSKDPSYPYDNVFGDVVIAKGNITGSFDNIELKFPSYLFNTQGMRLLSTTGDPQLYSNDVRIHTKDELNSLTLRLGQTYQIISPRTASIEPTNNYNILLASAQDNVNSELQTHNLVLSSSDFEGYVAANEVVENTIANSPLTDLAASLKVSFDDKMVQESSKLFQGTEFTEAVEHNQMLHQAALSKATSQLFSFDADGKTNSTVSTDYLAASNGSTSYLTAVNANYQLGQHKLALGVNQGGSSWKHSQASDKNKHTTFGGTVGYATQLAQEFGVNAYAGYQHSSNDLVRNLTILDTPYNHNDKLVVNETVLGANFFYNVPVPAQFQVFLGANQHWSNTSAVTEQYGKEDQAYRLELGKNSVNYTNLVVGAHFTQGNLLGTYGWQGLDLDASYELAYSLNHWNELNAQLADNVLTVKQTYARNNPSNLTHQAALSLTQQLDKTFSVGAKASLLSGSETYKALGLYLNARF